MSLARLWRALPAWSRRPDFALVIVVGALLRLIWLDDTSFLGDQAQMLAVARSALSLHALPLAGIESSIGTLNPPASIYLLLPFAALPDPFWAALFTALANVGAVVLLYRIADRYAGRAAAFAAGVLYATAAGPVWYSRFIWQQNLLAPVLLLFFWTLCRGVIDRRPGWLPWNLACWAVAVQLHPTAAPLLALTGVGIALTWRNLRWRDAYTSAIITVVLFAPYLLWLALSGASDVGRLLGSAGGNAVLDVTAPAQLLMLALPAPQDAMGVPSLYTATYPLLAPLVILVALLVLASALWIVELAARPLLPLATKALRRITGRRSDSQPNPREADLIPLALESRTWRFYALLALWELLPLLVMLRHSQPVFPHYLLVSLPAVFLVLGIFLARLPATLSRLAVSLHGGADGVLARSVAWLRVRAGAIFVGLVLLLAVGQAFGTGAQLVAIHQGAFEAAASGSHYGWPLDDQRAALQAAQSAARPLGASVMVASDALHQQSLGYLATTSYGPATVYDDSACLVTPAAGSQPQVTLSTDADTSRALLRRLSGATLVKTLPATAGLDPALYRLAPGATLPGEVAAPPTTSQGKPGQPQLAGYLFDRGAPAAPFLMMRWTGAPTLDVPTSQALRYYFGASAQPGAASIAHYRFLAQPMNSQNQPLAAPLTADCPRLAWAQGMNVYTQIAYPQALAGHVASWRVWVEVAPFAVTRPSLGAWRFETGAVREGSLAAIGNQASIPGA